MPLTELQAEFKAYLKNRLFDTVRPLTIDELESKAGKFAELLFEDLSTNDLAQVLLELTQENEVSMPNGGSIVDQKTFTEWIGTRKSTIETPRWSAYKKLLIQRDWEANVIDTLDKQTDDVVELLGDPEQGEGSWPRRGLLMGEVQSGKTATYLGILNKALDFGYGVVVVIGGHTEDLRQQTQARFDTDLLGIDSETWEDGISNAAIRRVGIGELSDLRAHLMTTVRHDFSKAKRGSSITWVDGGLPTVFITKKNPSLLENIRTYIKSQAPGGRLDIPLIVIDDESDWGSPNTREKIDPTSVNRAIRALLDVSTKSTYLAITATPFANIFIDDQASFEFVEKVRKGEEQLEPDGAVLNDLFPSDYIRVTYPPDTYSGISTYFSGSNHPSVKTEVADCIALIPIKHKNHHPVSELPLSLKVATIEFIIGTAVRRIRDGAVKPASMLINISRFKSVERSVAALEELFVSEVATTVLGEFKRETEARSDLARFIEKTWNENFANVTDLKWGDVAEQLTTMVSEVRVDLVNGDTAKDRAARRKAMSRTERKLDDLQPRIVVGGDILSRGLTLDGLQVSYFVREPRTMDTLMQMGRWFGYRQNYSDLVRIWMPESTRADFRHSAEVMQELREALVDMKARSLTPRDFGLRIRVHPDSVDIVASNKGRDSKTIEIGPTVWQNRLVESHDLSGNDEIEQTNRASVQTLVDALAMANAVKTVGGYTSWTNVEPEHIEKFFSTFESHRFDTRFGRLDGKTPPIADALRVTPGSNRWQVVIVNGGEEPSFPFGPAIPVKMSVRNNLGRHKDQKHVRLDRRRLSSANDLGRSLIQEEYDAIESQLTRTSDGPPVTSQAAFLAGIDHPLLLIYAVTAKSPALPHDPEYQSVEAGFSRTAVAIAFPKMTQSQIVSASATSRTYKVNQVYWRALHGYVEDTGDDLIESGESE
ncbi:hypothetical protein C5C99_05510 [Rathayibacter sp. AY1C4]|uniref:Z1 domain-containing protein n=1 Tax=Rathayibacter sp. AY1C4 TaxID=2080537 RepID=UPI000CE8B6FB|nr:Z1 domain-containing protein [Rathayibacter sp. AY1C4]PPH22005.1 hypothetical protein C5C99_05510 [Rathayibacter sp. AY1C4]